MRVAADIVLKAGERAVLTALVRTKFTSVRLALRARIVLLGAKGLQNKDIAVQVGVGRVQVSRWRALCAFASGGYRVRLATRCAAGEGRYGRSEVLRPNRPESGIVLPR